MGELALGYISLTHCYLHMLFTHAIYTCYLHMLFTHVIYTCYLHMPISSAGFTYRASKLRGPPAKVCNIFYSVIGFSYICCHNTLHSVNNPLLLFSAQLHLISEYYRIILSTIHHPTLFNLPLAVGVGY